MEDRQPIVIELPNGMRVRGVALVTGRVVGDEESYELTVPNSTIRIQHGKLVKHLELKMGQSETLTLASGSARVTEPLTQLVSGRKK